jgi:hypothetical protein
MLNLTSRASLRGRYDDMEDEIRTYAELQEQMHDALREQHPEWIEANGECSACQLYESRFAEQLELLAKKPPTRPSDTGQAELPARPPGEESQSAGTAQ